MCMWLLAYLVILSKLKRPDTVTYNPLSSPTQVKSINEQHIFHQTVGKMSRGGRRGGGFSGRDLPPMGLTFADIQNMSREAAELYPVCFLLFVISILAKRTWPNRCYLYLESPGINESIGLDSRNLTRPNLNHRRRTKNLWITKRVRSSTKGIKILSRRNQKIGWYGYFNFYFLYPLLLYNINLMLANTD